MANGNDSGATASSELARLDKENSEKSILRKAIDFVTEPYHHEAAARQKLQEAAFGGGDATAAVKASQSASQAEADAYNISSSAIKTVGTFTRGKFGFIATGAAYALDEIRPGN